MEERGNRVEQKKRRESIEREDKRTGRGDMDERTMGGETGKKEK